MMMPSGLGLIVLQAIVWVVLALIAALVAGRFIRAAKVAEARAAFVASIFALAGMATLDVGIPLDTLNSWTHGGNVWNLAEALCSTCAFWFFNRSIQLIVARDEKGVRSRKAQPSHRWVLVASITLQTLLFFSITDRYSPPESFVVDHISQAACYAYLSVYILTVAGLSAVPWWALRGRPGWTSRVFRAGYIAVGAACVWHFVFLTLAYLQLVEDPVREWMRQSFYFIFVPGVLLLAAGFAGTFLRARQKSFQLVWRVRCVRLELLSCKLAGESSGLRAASAAFRGDSPRAHAEALLVEIYDAVIRDDALLTTRELRLIDRTNSGLLRQLGVSAELARLTEGRR